MTNDLIQAKRYQEMARVWATEAQFWAMENSERAKRNAIQCQARARHNSLLALAYQSLVLGVQFPRDGE